MQKELCFSRVMIAATNSGAGKTTLVCGLMQALKNRDMQVSAFKCGPDYIDPSFYREIIGTRCTNIDLFFQDRNTMINIMADYAEKSDISIIEGVMGYYDGIGGKSADASAYDVSQNINTSVILVVDAKGASLSIAATIKGFKDFMPNSKIEGVILNRCSKMQYILVKDIIKYHTNVEVLGYLPYNDEYSFESRHLGLINAFEVDHIHKKLNILADQIEETVEVDKIIGLANKSENLSYEELKIEKITEDEPLVAVAMDKAFSFYYAENISFLEKLGSKIEYFSPIKDAKLPENTSAIYIGGGYPELHLQSLAENITMKMDIKSKVEEGMPIIAECGGYMYLTKDIDDYDMVGLIDASAYNAKKLGRFGYIELTAYEDSMLANKGEKIKAHEFHYYDTTFNGETFLAKKPLRKKSWDCVHASKNMYAGFPHLYFYSNVRFAENFVEAAVYYKESNQR